MSPLRDLIALVADTHIQRTVQAILQQSEKLGIRPLQIDRSDIQVDPRHDPGCLLYPHDLLQLHVRHYGHALVVFDRQGCGQETTSAQKLQQQVEDRLAQSGWEGRSAAIAIDPELETWVWSDSPHLDECLGWAGRQPTLRRWLEKEGLWPDGQSKPFHPQNALRTALKEARKSFSSSVFMQLASKISFKRCTDPAFHRLRTILQKWFPPARR